jgi:hypothetical protein
MFHRVEPTSRSRLSMILSREPANVLDISCGGAKLSYPKTLLMRPNTFSEASLHIDSRVYSVRARIVRTWDGSIEGSVQGLRFAAIEFLHSDSNLGRVLSRKIREIEVESRHEGAPPITDIGKD